ncbi:MAG: hypothetical protein MI919_11030, partial [Holophagales bacterium]|nr:hypothetical protein [Holophagales bacterium]
MKNEALGLLAVALLALVVAIFASGTRTGRLAGLAVPEEPFRHVYVLGRVGSDQKCLVTDRAGATVRRSEPDLAGSRWRCHWGAGEVASRTLVAVTGKEPSYVFVPAGQVFDPVFPWVYEAVRDRLRAPRELRDLPRLRWVHLYHDRLYQGFHLQLRLPDRRFAERRGLGRTELISVLGDRAWCWNRKLRGACRLWNEAFVAEAIFPEPLVTPATRLLDSLLPPEASRAYFLTETSRGAPPREPPAGAPFAAWAEPVPPRDGEAMPVDLMPGAWRAERQPVVPLVGNLHPLPLPFALEEVLATVPAEEPRDRGGLYVDARFRAWGRLGGSPWSEDPRWVIELSHLHAPEYPAG